MESVTYNDGRTFRINERVSFRTMYSELDAPRREGVISAFVNDAKGMARTTVLMRIRRDDGVEEETSGGCVRKLDQ